MNENLKDISIKAKKKLKNANLFVEVYLMKLDQSIKSSIVFQKNLAQLSKSILAAILCHNKTVPDGLNLLVSRIGIEI